MSETQERKHTLLELTGYNNFHKALRYYYLSVHPYCYYCGKQVTAATSNLEHLLPTSTHKYIVKPKVLTCIKCNSLRGNQLLSEFLAWFEENDLFVDRRRAYFAFNTLCPQSFPRFVRWARDAHRRGLIKTPL